MARVLLINNRFGYNAVGGAERIVEREQRSICKNGDTTVVLATEKFHGIASFFIHQHSDEVDVYRWSPINICSYEQLGTHSFLFRLIWHGWDVMNIPAALILRSFIKRFNPDQISTHNVMGGAMMVRWCLMGGVKKILWRHTLHDIQLLQPSGIILWGHEQSMAYVGLAARAYRALTRLLITPNIVVSPSQWLLNEHRRWGFFLLCISRVESPTAFLKPTKQRVTYGDRRARMFLFVGQVEYHKGIAFLIDALKHYDHAYTLTVVGTGSRESALRAYTRNDSRYHWLGVKSLQELTSLYEQCDAIIVPSLCYENAPTVIVEARERLTPIIASRIGGIPELIDDLQGLFEPNNELDCIRAIYSVVGPLRS